MQIHKPLSLLLILAVCCTFNSFAATDSLPTCIKNLTSSKLSTYTEYEYNGKKLFSFTKVPTTTPINYYDSLGTIKYYDSTCKLFCTWIRGGIMGSKMIPATIKKEKIIVTRVFTFDTITKKNPAIINLPDTITKIALLKKSNWIEETIYDEKIVYRFQNPLDKSATITFVNPFFDENGKIVSVIKLLRQAFWWHNVKGKFSRTQFRPGYR